MKRFPAIVAISIRPQTPAELDLFRHQTFAHLGIDRRPKDFPEMTISSHVVASPPDGGGVGRHSAPAQVGTATDAPSLTATGGRRATEVTA